MSFLVCFGLTGCPVFDATGTGDGSSGSAAGDVTHREQQVSGTLAIASGGVAEGSDEIQISDSFRFLDFTTEDDALFSLEFIGEANSFAEGGGARVVPHAEGIGTVTPILDNRNRDPVEVIIPPQKLIQVLMGEARGQMDDEATLNGDGKVKPTSVSVTGDAVAAVIRNRIGMIDDTGSPGLFNVDADAYAANPPISSYNAVIEAVKEGVFQFGPVDPAALSHEVYLDSAARADIARADRTAYDQAVSTAAYIFSGTTEDPTGGCFSFYSPDEQEYQVLRNALETQTLTLPEGAGASDAQYPSLAPIQILVLSDVAPSNQHDAVPSFVFVRERHPDDPAVTDEP